MFFIINTDKFYSILGPRGRYRNNLAFMSRFISYDMGHPPVMDREETTLQELMKPFMEAITFYWGHGRFGEYKWTQEDFNEVLKYFLECKCIRFYKTEDEDEKSELLTWKKCEKLKLI